MPRGLSAFTERQKEHTRQQRQRTRQSAGIVENRKRLWKAVWMRPSLCKILNRKMLTVNTVSAATGTLLPYRRPYGTLAASPSGAGRLSLECSGLPVIRPEPSLSTPSPAPDCLLCHPYRFRFGRGCCAQLESVSCPLLNAARQHSPCSL